MTEQISGFEEIKSSSPPDQQQEDDSLAELVNHYWRLLRTYYWLIALACLVGSVGGYFWTQQQPELFRSSSKIVYHHRQGNILGRNVEQVEFLDPGGRWEFDQFWNTQKQVFSARWFAKRVIEREGLISHPDFLSEPEDGEERSPAEAMDAAIGKLIGQSDVRLQRDSRVAVIAVQSEYPKLASTIANGMAEAYIEYTKEFQSGGLKEITTWFDSYVEKKRQELEGAQSKLQDFKRKKNILSFSYEDRQNLTASNMESVNKDLMKVRKDLSSERALLEQIDQLKKEGDIGAIAELVDSESLREAYLRKAKFKEDLAKLTAKYLDQHPQVQSKTQQLKTVQENIEDEIARNVSAVKNRVELLERKKKNLETELARLKEKVFELNELGVQYTQLKDKTDNLKEMYQTVLKRSSELDINSMYQGNEIEVLESAQVPEAPFSPSLPLNLALGIILGMSAGGATIVLIDALDTTVKSKDEVTQLTDKPILTMLPRLQESVQEGIDVIGESAADTITHTAPKSSFAEGIKTLRTNLTFMSPDDPPETLLVTSPGPGEGKTVSATNMAIAMAQSGQKTLIIDSDLRRPRLHKALDVDKKPGLTTIIRDNQSVEQVSQETPIDNLFAITCGDVPPNPSELLHSDRFHEFLDEANGIFDRVIFDSPPLAAVSDALILSHVVDGVLLIVEFGKTRRETLERSLEQLRGIGAPLLGCVLNEVSDDVPGYGYSYYRYSYYGEDQDEAETQRLAG